MGASGSTTFSTLYGTSSLGICKIHRRSVSRRGSNAAPTILGCLGWYETIARIKVSMYRLSPRPINECVDKTSAEKEEQKDPAGPCNSHECGKKTAWRILMAPAQVTPHSLC